MLNDTFCLHVLFVITVWELRIKMCFFLIELNASTVTSEFRSAVGRYAGSTPATDHPDFGCPEFLPSFTKQMWCLKKALVHTFPYLDLSQRYQNTILKEKELCKILLVQKYKRNVNLVLISSKVSVCY